MKRIGVIAGDGIGPEVVHEARRVADAIMGPDFFLWDELPWGAEHTLATGVTIDPDEFDRFKRDYDAMFLGALGDPRIPDMRHGRDILLGARRNLDLFVNLRPIKLTHERLCPLKGVGRGEIDLVIFRENTEGIYIGKGHHVEKGGPNEVAVSELLATRRGTERIIRAGFEHCRAQGKARLCMASKHNAVPHAHGLWFRVFEELKAEYPDVTATVLYADVAAMELVRDPRRFDVIVASNLLGDILSDLAAQLVGGLGVAPSANLHPGQTSLFEPVHGSAPDIAGTGRANPLAAILTAALMLRELGEHEAALRIEGAVSQVIEDGETTPDLGGSLDTASAGAAVMRRL